MKELSNCFTTVYKYLSEKYNLPKEWNGYTDEDMDLFVTDQKRFLAKRQHIKFFRSFCKRVDKAQKDDIVLTSRSVGCAINRFAYWVYNEDLKKTEHKYLDDECLIYRINHG